MNYNFVPMNKIYAATIVENWRYPDAYAIYDYANEADHMLDESAWGKGIFAVLDEPGDLVGELSIEFFDEHDQPLDYADFDNPRLTNQRELWIGFGLRPDLVGQGRGGEFVAACTAYAVEKYNYHGPYVGLGVAMFNQRAIKAYTQAGFQIFKQTTGQINGRTFECIHMHKNCKSSLVGRKQ